MDLYETLLEVIDCKGRGPIRSLLRYERTFEHAALITVIDNQLKIAMTFECQYDITNIETVTLHLQSLESRIPVWPGIKFTKVVVNDFSDEVICMQQIDIVITAEVTMVVV